ncbi:hypothetical protein M422DRAFT_67166 [Sphaerobolus stellatus SS14]|uniref:Unplaced genomic scaffold SPHSTscaffold_36, whole genome shotgun sequence n=1 Tax=Sphaerobolus stellatus (strain SS14) TaxID=990650 RepID=A0A0C9VT57_SPHS4|nr:hypothetical protein M422DRAFT_67166 [Sphaerobolus stellatus SS14]
MALPKKRHRPPPERMVKSIEETFATQPTTHDPRRKFKISTEPRPPAKTLVAPIPPKDHPVQEAGFHSSAASSDNSTPLVPPAIAALLKNIKPNFRHVEGYHACK